MTNAGTTGSTAGSKCVGLASVDSERRIAHFPEMRRMSRNTKLVSSCTGTGLSQQKDHLTKFWYAANPPIKTIHQSEGEVNCGVLMDETEETAGRRDRSS